MNIKRHLNVNLIIINIKSCKKFLLKLKENEHHHHHHYDFSEKSKREERIKNEDKKVFLSSEYRRKLENARVAA
jgi:hypothetical protein